jgi:hypothetical protein
MALEGTLSYMDISHLLRVVGSAQKSGILEIRWQQRQARLHFQQGRLLRAESNRIRDGIGTLLVRSGILDAADLERALSTQETEGNTRRLGAILSDDFGVKPEEIHRLLLEQSLQIVYDVFSWPGGRFRLEFRDPAGRMDRFHHDAIQFIEEVGVQAGYLAREGAAQEEGDAGLPPILLLMPEAEFAERCRAFWRQKGHRVTLCERLEEALDLVTEKTPRRSKPVVILDGAGHDAIAALRASDSSAWLVLIAAGDGPKGSVQRPRPEQLAGPDGESRLQAFFSSMEAAVEAAMANG